MPPGHSREELRTEAIAALCLPDVVLVREVGNEMIGTKGFTIDAAFQRYAWADKDGKVHIHRLSDGEELLQLHGDNFVSEGVGLQFSPDGRFLHLSGQVPGKFRSLMWDLDAPQPRTVLDDEHGSLAFRPDSRQVAAAYPDGTIRFLETTTGRELRRFQIGTPPNAGLHWNPRLPQLLLHANPSLRLLNVDTGEASTVGPKPPGGYSGVDWHPEGRLLALSDQQKIYLWDVRAGRLALPPLEGHKASGIAVRFNRAGDRLFSTDWRTSGYLWGTRNGRRLLTLPGLHSLPQVSPDDNLVGGLVNTGIGVKIQLSHFRRGQEFRTLAQGLAAPRVYSQGHSCFDPEGRLCAIWSQSEGIALVDPVRGEEAGRLPLPPNMPLRFDSEGTLWTCGPAGLLRWPIALDPQTGQRRYGPPQRILSRAPTACHDGSVDVQVVSISNYERGARVFHRKGRRLLNLGPQEDVRYSAVSPDGRWVVTGSHGLHEGVGAKVWDAKDGRHIKDLPVGGLCRVQFSLDGKWLMTTSGGCRLWAVGSWEEGPKLGGASANPAGAFSHDGKLLALGDAPGVVRLVVTDSGRELARLTAPEQVRLAPCCFTPDGTQLLVVGAETTTLHLFDLRAIRAGLDELGLDWDAPPYPPAAAPKIPPPLDVTVDLGLLLPQEPPQQAVVKYSLALAILPLNPVAYLRRGHAHYQLRQWSQAADDLGLALALDPGNSDVLAWLELASACLICGRPKEAATAYDRAIRLEGDDPSLYNQRGVIYYVLGLWNKAIADISKTLELQPDFPMAKNNLAWLLAACPEPKFRNPARAVELAKQAVASQPRNGTFCTTLGVAHYRAGDWTAARNALQKSLQLGQGQGSQFWFGRTMLFLALSSWQLGDKEKARTHYQKAIEWMEKNQPALEKDPGRWKELRRFRVEADAVLVPPHCCP